AAHRREGSLAHERSRYLSVLLAIGRRNGSPATCKTTWHDARCGDWPHEGARRAANQTGCMTSVGSSRRSVTCGDGVSPRGPGSVRTITYQDLGGIDHGVAIGA